MTDLHCGACMESFETLEKLSEHIKGCPAARVLLPTINDLALFCLDAVGHPKARFLHNLHENVHLIKRYAYSVADELDTLLRAKIHLQLCKALNLDYSSFRPFESSEITTLPTRDEALNILWDAIELACWQDHPNKERLRY